MKILAIRTDKPEAELYIYENEMQLAAASWQAHRRLAETIHEKIDEILKSVKASSLDLSSEAGSVSQIREHYKSSITLKDVGGIVCYSGPGSFTGLRIGASVANALAYAQNIPVVSSAGNDWLKIGTSALLAGQNDKFVSPEYGSPARTTPPKK
jgi:tRNA A37 threonylcarbamoyladenosine modification protein TsaB